MNFLHFFVNTKVQNLHFCTFEIGAIFTLPKDVLFYYYPLIE